MRTAIWCASPRAWASALETETDRMTLVGRQIGRYRILEQLGSGGMSVVYKGLDTTLDREVAVKVLHPHLAGKDESRRRLAREAKAVAKLHHPNILEVFDFSAVEAQEAYLVTEYIQGTTLRQFMTEHEDALQPPEVGAMVIHELASALAHAHEAGIIHRDLKPENVMVREDGVLKLMDFGIAKMLDREEKMTVTGALVGSPAHMAPEIIEGLEAGPPADVFSLGTMLYLLATGRLPFTANNTTATLKRILDGVYPDPRQLAPALSDELAEILATSLARQPSARYPHAGKLRDALATYLAGLGVTRVGEELAAFFTGPKAYRKQLVPRIVDALLAQSERYRADKRPAKALASLNHVLSLDASNARALALLGEINEARKRAQASARRKRIATLAAGALALGAVTAVIVRALPLRPAQRLPALPERTLQPGTAAVAQGSAGTPKPPSGADAQGPAAGARPAAETQVAQASATVEAKSPEARLATASKSAEPRPTPPRVVASAQPPRPAAAPAMVPVVIKVRPFGYLRVDGGPRSPEALSQHTAQLAPGRHTLTVSCDFCQDTTESFEAKPAGGNEINVAALLKSSRLSFDVQPPDAVVKVGQELRAAKETAARPFEVPLPRGHMGRYPVAFEISAPGYFPLKGTAEVTPGSALTLTRKLEAE